MKNLLSILLASLFLLVGLFLLAGCATTVERIIMPPLERIDPDLMFYQTGKSRPEWVKKNWWQESDKLYVVGTATRLEVKDIEARLRVAEVDAMGGILKAKNICRGHISGMLRRQIWQERDGAIFVLMEADADVESLDDTTRKGGCYGVE